MIDENRLQRLLDKDDLHDLMYRYARGVDRFDKELVRTCFWPDATAVFPLSRDAVFRGTYNDYLEIDAASWEPYTAQQHYLCNQLCEIDGNQARAETYQFSFYWTIPGIDPTLNSQNSGRYIDRYERREGTWRIIHREFIRNFSFPIRPEGFPSLDNGWPMSFQSHDDPAYRKLGETAQ